ncbi:hypothetical protein [Streptomyces cinnamoneus]|uniref:Uncharacterized protein n=1 Tax=Streptomyces cinnamoneus TaxID=53446 RepID=A0A918TBX4_STRCJ|nr:hypothetical protein [Streptomyces cinnamoneus]GHC39364.1 hypothetical protein GCM10010507_11420 [Streptomyces cinnamoneus]
MLRLVLREGDIVTPLPQITSTTPTPGLPGTLTPVPTPLPGSAAFTVERMTACVPEDIERLRIYVFYATPAYPVLGIGEIRLTVSPRHRSRHARTRRGTEVALDGGPLDLVLVPQVPASNPSNPTVPNDPSKEYAGRATLSCPRIRPVRAGSRS